MCHQCCPQAQRDNILKCPSASPSSSHLHPGLLGGGVPAGRDGGVVLDDALRVHRLPGTGFPAAERKRRVKNNLPTFCWRQSPRWQVHLRDQDRLVFTICQREKYLQSEKVVGKVLVLSTTCDLVSIRGNETKSLQAKLKRCMVCSPPLFPSLYSTFCLLSCSCAPSCTCFCFCLYPFLITFNIGQDFIQIKTMDFGDSISTSSVLDLPAVA